MASFGVDVYLAVLGQFRTGILATNIRKTERAVNSIPEYDAATEAFHSRLEHTNGKQPGDPAQAVERIVDIVDRKGHFTGHQNIPLRIVLGSDAVEIVRSQCQEMLNDLDKQKDLGKSTDFLEKASIQRYE